VLEVVIRHFFERRRARGEKDRESRWRADHFLIFGHRGSPRRFPENTVESFEEALRAGADGFETDLRLLSDRVAVLYHDDQVGEEATEALTWRDFERRGLRVQRVRDLSRFTGRGTMILEVKRRKWEDALLAEISNWPNIVVASFDHSIIAELARRNVRFALGLTLSGYIVDLPSYARRLSATWCFPEFQYVDADLVAALHAGGVRVVPWTPNRPGDWARLRQINCDGVITDYPAEAVQWRGSGAAGS
jgi:glycerophosphoryl diester phosphodiesterase